jgi:hypothetical protein
LSFSLSAKAKAKGTSFCSGSTATAIMSVPLYLPVKKVPSTSITGRQCWKATWHCGKHQKTRRRTGFKTQPSRTWNPSCKGTI